MSATENIRQTWWWLLGVITNPPVVFTEDYGSRTDSEQWTRRQRWAILRPIWFYYALATQQKCGCVQRWWGTKSIFCHKHARLELGH